MVRLISILFLAAVVWAPKLTAHDWPRWRGPDLNGISKEKSWTTVWPKEGPRQLWKANAGMGFSSITVSERRAFTMGNKDEQDTVYCFDAATGKEVWRYAYAEPLDPRFYEGGTSCTPTVEGETAYVLSRKGKLFSLDASSGKVKWQKDIAREHGLTIPEWGFAGAPLVQGELLILNAGTHGLALKKASGELAWSTGTASAGYATPLPFETRSGVALAIFGWRTLAAVALSDGKVLWEIPWKTDYDINAADPIVSGDKMFISSGYRKGGALFKLDGKPTQIWAGQSMHNQLNSSVLIDKHLYGISGQNGREADLRCVEFETGTVRWQEKSAGFGALMAADGKLIVLSEKGELIIAEATAQKFNALARAQVLGGKCWTVPVLAGGRIYCRNVQGNLVCVDVAETQVASEE
jgi:outer membrane protein assembly factor BamB